MHDFKSKFYTVPSKSRSNDSILEALIPGWGRGEAKAQMSDVKDRPFASLWSDFMMDETS
jgi:hypothetical protein